MTTAVTIMMIIIIVITPITPAMVAIVLDTDIISLGNGCCCRVGVWDGICSTFEWQSVISKSACL